jgi:hypothetical protein
MRRAGGGRKNGLERWGMTPVNGDFDQMLRRALHAEVDSIEPDEGGLDRIRRRTHAPWLMRQTSLMLTECVDLTRLIGIRLEPGFAGLRTVIDERGGPREAFVGLLSSTVASIAQLFTPPRRRPTHRSPSTGSTLAWLRPALAVAGAVVIVVAGVYGLVQVRDTISLELFPSGSPTSNGPGSSGGGGQGPSLNGQSAPAGVVPNDSQTGSASPSPEASCSSSPKAQAAPTTSPTDDPSPTVTPTGTPTDPAPTVTPTDTPSDTPSTSAVSLGGPGVHTVAVVAPASCRSASPSQSS